MAEGILSTKEAQEQKAMELLGDTEYTLPFYMKLENNPLFKIGFDPERIYYQREGEYGRGKRTDHPGSYFSRAFNKEIIQYHLDRAIKNNDPIYAERMQEVLKNIEDPSDFVFMEGAGKELTDKNKSTVVHEFVHRSLYENPELVKFYNKNKLGYDERAHGLISYMVGQEFPKMKEQEYERAKAIYDIDLNDKETENEFKNLYDEATQISQNILDKKLEESRAKEPVVPYKPKEEKEEPSFFSKIKEKLGFNKGGIADINYLTRRL